MAGGDSLVAHPRVCRPRCEVVCRNPGRHSQCNAAHQRLRESGRDAVSAAHRLHPGRPGVLPVLRRRGPGPLRGEGQVAAPPPAQLLAGLGQAHAPDGPDGGPGRPRRVGGGRQRGRRADPGALADPGPPAPLQRPPQGRQELPLARRHGERGVAAPGGGARPQAQGRPLLRPLRQRRRHPVHARPPGAELPRAHVLGHEVHPPRAPERPCLLYDIDRCSGPCVGAVDHAAYDGYVDDLMGFLSGDTEPVLARLEAEMLEASEELQFERAARLRDRIVSVHKAAESQQMVSDRAEDFDVVGLAEDPLEASVQIFLVRRGRVVGHRGFVAEKVEDLSGPEFMATVVSQVYGADGAEVPRRLLVPEEPADRELLQSWLHTIRGGPVDIAIPQRGAKRALQETVTRSASEDLARHRLRRAADHNARSKALTELQSALALREAPLADRVLRHEPPAGHRLRGLHGRVRGRPGQALRLPALQGEVGAGQRRLRRHGGGVDAPAHRPEAGAGGEAGRAAPPLRLPAQPDRRRRRQGAAGGGRAGRARARAAGRGRAGLAGQAVRGGVPAGFARTRSACAGAPTPSTCCSGCATRRTASPSPSTGSGGASG